MPGYGSGAGEKLQYSWRYDGYEGNSFVTFELFAEGDKTRVKLTHEGLETLAAANQDFCKRELHAGMDFHYWYKPEEFCRKSKRLNSATVFNIASQDEPAGFHAGFY